MLYAIMVFSEVNILPVNFFNITQVLSLEKSLNRGWVLFEKLKIDNIQICSGFA